MTLAQIQAEAAERYPIKKTDCRLTKMRQEGLRKAYIERRLEEIKTPHHVAERYNNPLQ